MKTRRGNGPRHPRLHTSHDMIGKSTRKDGLIEEPFYPSVFKKGFDERREFHDKALQELLLATGWKSVHEKTITVQVEKPTLIEKFFFTEFPITYSKKRDKFFFSSCRLYLGRIEMPNCKKAHRCGVVDISTENPMRGLFSQKRVNLEVLVEKACSCFNEEERDHEGTLYLYRWR